MIRRECSQLWAPCKIKQLIWINQLMAIINEKHPKLVKKKGIISHQDKTTLCLFLWLPDKNCYWEGFYSFAIFTWYYIFGFLFWFLKNSFHNKNLNSLGRLHYHLWEFFGKMNLWEDRIRKLPERWHKIVEQNVNCSIKSMSNIKKNLILNFYLANKIFNWMSLFVNSILS